MAWRSASPPLRARRPGIGAEPLIVTDIATDPLWQKHRELARQHGLRACWSAPILAKDDRLLGAYAIYHRQPRAPDAADLQVIEVLSRTAAIAIEAKRAERQERLLVEELSHRVKNTLATAQSLATQTLRKSASPERFAAAFSGRLAALAKAHTLLANEGWTGAGLHDLIREQLAAYRAADDASVTIQGDDLSLEPSAALFSVSRCTNWPRMPPSTARWPVLRAASRSARSSAEGRAGVD